MEIWKPIPGFEGVYECSSYGRIKSLSRPSVNRCGTIVLKEKILKSNKSSGGYLNIGLRKNKSRHTFTVSRLVAISFLHNPNNLPEVNHKDGNKLNNRVENLEWCTSKFNTIHAHSLGLVNHLCGLENVKSKPVSQRDQSGKLVNVFSSINLAKEEGFWSSGIVRCCQGKTPLYKGYQWKYI